MRLQISSSLRASSYPVVVNNQTDATRAELTFNSMPRLKSDSLGSVLTIICRRSIETELKTFGQYLYVGFSNHCHVIARNDMQVNTSFRYFPPAQRWV